MEELKDKNIYELLNEINKQVYYLYTHNKNYTKMQYNTILDLQDYIEELETRLK